MSFGFDGESSLQDADIEMADLNATADRHARLAAKGICTHGWLQTRPIVKCKDCGQEFASVEAAMEAADMADA